MCARRSQTHPELLAQAKDWHPAVRWRGGSDSHKTAGSFAQATCLVPSGTPNVVRDAGLRNAILGSFAQSQVISTQRTLGAVGYRTGTLGSFAQATRLAPSGTLQGGGTHTSTTGSFCSGHVQYPACALSGLRTHPGHLTFQVLHQQRDLQFPHVSHGGAAFWPRVFRRPYGDPCVLLVGDDTSTWGTPRLQWGPSWAGQPQAPCTLT